MKRFVPFALLLALFAGCDQQPAPIASAPPPASTSIAVAAAADLKYALDDIVTEFQRIHPALRVETSYGASGKLFAQLSNKAPFDMFLSADIGFPQKLIEQGDAWKESEFQYAVGHIGVWVRNDSPLDLDKHDIAVLNDPAVQKIAIANPKTAPYGRAAEAALKHFDIYNSVKDRLVLGENVAQTMQFVESGAADIGIVAQSLALAPVVRDKGRFWQLPADSYPPLQQGGVILTWARDRTACETLREFVISESGQSILRRYGFGRSSE